MSDEIIIECPSCDSELEIPIEFLGETLECPSCEAPIELPSAADAGLEESAPEPEPEPEEVEDIKPRSPRGRGATASGRKKMKKSAGRSGRKSSRASREEEPEEEPEEAASGRRSRKGRGGKAPRGKGKDKGKGKKSRREAAEEPEEFDGDIGDLVAPMAGVAGWMKFLGVMMILAGIGSLVFLLVGVFFIICGILLFGAASLFQHASRKGSAKSFKQGLGKLALMIKMLAIAQLCMLIVSVVMSLVVPGLIAAKMMGGGEPVQYDINGEVITMPMDGNDASDMLGDGFGTDTDSSDATGADPLGGAGAADSVAEDPLF